MSDPDRSNFDDEYYVRIRALLEGLGRKTACNRPRFPEQDNIWTNDTGNGIAGYRLDLYEGVGKAACAGSFANANPMAVGACSSGTNTCPALTVQ